MRTPAMPVDDVAHSNGPTAQRPARTTLLANTLMSPVSLSALLMETRMANQVSVSQAGE